MTCIKVRILKSDVSGGSEVYALFLEQKVPKDTGKLKKNVFNKAS